MRVKGDVNCWLHGYRCDADDYVNVKAGFKMKTRGPIWGVFLHLPGAMRKDFRDAQLSFKT